MMTLLYLILGIVLAVAYLHRAVRPIPDPRQRLGFALLVAAFIYVAFAMAAMESTWLLVELVGVLIFSGFVVLGNRRSVLWLAVGWVMHVGWDIGIHLVIRPSFAPLWYPITCISFDLIIAAYIVHAVKKDAAPWTAGPPNIRHEQEPRMA